MQQILFTQRLGVSGQLVLKLMIILACVAEVAVVSPQVEHTAVI